jgi:hypothetical protein
MDIVAFDFRKFSHDGDVLYDGMRVDVEGPGLQSAMPFRRRQLRRRPRVPRTGRDRIVMNVLMPLNAWCATTMSARRSDAAGCVAAPPGL